MTNWYGEQRAGWYEYTTRERDEVVAAVEEHAQGRGNRMKTPDFYELCSVSPRAVQQILSDCDGLAFLLVRSKGGLYACTNESEAAEAGATTRNLRVRAATELARADRRDKFATKWLAQGALI